MKNKINDRLKQAMKDKDSLLLSVLRNINSKITEFEKSIANKIASDTDILVIIEKLAKQREEAIKLYIQGNRDDLVINEQLELNILKGYLPTKMTEDETRIVIIELVEIGLNNVGLIMRELNKYGNTIDKKLASEIIKEFTF